MASQATLTIDAAAALARTTGRRIKYLIHIKAIATVDAAFKGPHSNKTLFVGVLILQEEFTTWLAAGGMRKTRFPSRTAQRNRKAAHRAQHACHGLDFNA